MGQANLEWWGVGERDINEKIEKRERGKGVGESRNTLKRKGWGGGRGGGRKEMR